MYRSSLFLTAALLGTTIALVQQSVAVAKSTSEVEIIAKAVAVEIRLQQNKTVGSGVIIDRLALPTGNNQGALYTLVTNRHVVCGNQKCSELPPGEIYRLGLADGQQYLVKKSSIEMLGNDLDLAIIQFRSSRNYAVAKVAAPASLKTTDTVYTAGFPFEQLGFAFGEGKALAVVNKRLTGDNGGYTIIYDAFTLPGMSGGGVFDSNGQLVAIHGQGDRFKENTDLDNKSKVGRKIGANRGIPVRWLVQSLTAEGINLGGNSTSMIRAGRSQVPATADEYFITGFNKFVEPGNDVIIGKRQAIQELSTAIRLNSQYAIAYLIRAIAYGQIQDLQQSLNDYNQAILINPQFSEAYYNRALLKYTKLNDIPGALTDYNQAITSNPKNSGAYNNRAVLKKNKLSDYQGALDDYNQAILINPKYFEAYNNRALLKYENLNDTPGSLADYNQSISINPKFSVAYLGRAILKDDKNDIHGSLADYNEAIALNPQDAEAYYNRALLKSAKLNDIQGALADYNQAILINPKFSSAYNNRANLKYTKLNDNQGALEDFNEAIKIDPKDSFAYNNRALLKYEKLNDNQGALTDYNQAILINPKFSAAYYNRANLKYIRLNDHQGALADYDQSIALNPKYSQAYYNRATLKYAKLNDPQGALVDYNQTIAINPKFAEAYGNRGILKAYGLNDKAGAIQDFRQAARLFREQKNTQKLQQVITALQMLGATE
jgi:tetratricopeptide (TPR) repeat protein